MRLLITNDDGIDAAGLHALVGAVLAEGHEVLVVAPEVPSSGAGSSLATGDGEPIPIRRVEHPELPGVPFIGVGGSPALAVLLGRLGAFGPTPWGVVAGINHGSNTGRSVLHSGTVAAALTASTLGMSALAVSIASEQPSNLDTAMAVARAAVRVLIAARKRTVLSVNVPDLPEDRVLAPRWGRLAAAGQAGISVAEVTDDHVRLRLERSSVVLDPETDAGLLAAGHVVVTPLTGIRVATEADLGLDPAAALARLTTRLPTS